MSDDNRLFDLTRRKMLGSIGALGLGAALGGAGTAAFFSDEETFENNQLTAGSLDLKVDWTQHYYDGSEETLVDQYPDDGEILSRTEIEAELDDPTDEEVEEAFRAQFADVPDDVEAPLLDLDDVKPGDEGEVTFSMHLFDNPGYVWMNGTLINAAENGHTEPEAKDEDEVGGPETSNSTGRHVELLDVVRTSLWYDDGDNELADAETVVFEDVSLRDALDNLTANDGLGIPLGGAQENGDDGRGCFENSTTQYIGFKWWVPVDHGNEIQTDSVTFDLGFYAEQCRHNDGSGMRTVRTETGEMWAKQEENFNGDGTESSFARGRYGGTNTWELAVGDDTSNSAQADYSWTSGETVDWTYDYDEAADEASFTVDGVTAGPYSLTDQPDGAVAIQTKADEATIDVADVQLEIDGSAQTLDGPTAVTASNDGDGRDLQYLVLDTALDGDSDISLSGTVTITKQSDYDESAEEGVAFDVVLE